MSKTARMLDVLDLYSESVALLSAEEVATRLQVSRPTAFRYMRELSDAGFLANYGGRYSLGAKLIRLDYRIRSSDPVLKEARETMRTLSAETACDAVLCRMYNDEIIHVHHEAGHGDEALGYIGRGRPLPLFRGSASKAMLAFLPAARLKRMYAEHHHTDADVARIGADWPSFQRYFSRIRQAGHYLSDEEVDEGIIGIAAPILVERFGPVGVISLVLSAERLPLVNPDGLATMLKARNAEIASRLRMLADAPGATVQEPETSNAEG